MQLTTTLKTKYSSHIGADVEYPTTCTDLVTACNNMSEFSGEEKEWFSKALPHGSYKTPEEVKKAVGI